MKVVPDHTFETAPDPRVMVVPAQGGQLDAMRAWLTGVSESADVTMSVCTGAFVLAWAGLLAGQRATTHHDFLDRFEEQYPDIDVKRGKWFVEGTRISTAGGGGDLRHRHGASGRGAILWSPRRRGHGGLHGVREPGLEGLTDGRKPFMGRAACSRPWRGGPSTWMR